MDNTVVIKFGGTSVGSTERFGNAAKRVSDHIRKTRDQVVVVVSAMSGETNRLIELFRKVSGPIQNQREHDQLLASGEQVSAALLAIALQREGLKSVSLLAHQLQLKTEEHFGQNLISVVETKKINEFLSQGIVPVVAGFQGVDKSGSFTTLGRGGSDTTAVAIAAALGSCRCEILTDIDGVYTALPQICKKAKKLKKITYEEMLEMASSGAKVLQTRSVSLASKFKVPLFVGSSFNTIEGTEVVKEYEGMEDALVSGITCRTDEARLTLKDIPDVPGVAGKIFRVIGEQGVNVDMIVQSASGAGKTAVSFTVPDESALQVFQALQILIKAEMPNANIELDRDIAKLSVVGEGMRNHAGVASQVFQILGKEGINIDMITTSEIKISVGIKQKYSELAVRSLHEFFIENSNQQKEMFTG